MVSKTKSEACRIVVFVRSSSNIQKSCLLISHIKASGITKLNGLFSYLILRFRKSTADLSVQQRREVYTAYYFLIKFMHWLYIKHLAFIILSLSLSLKLNFLPHSSYA